MTPPTLTVRFWIWHGAHRHTLARLLRHVQWHAALPPAEFGKRP